MRRSGPAGPRPPRRPRVAGTRAVGPAGGAQDQDATAVEPSSAPEQEAVAPAPVGPPAPATAAPATTPVPATAPPEPEPEPEPAAPAAAPTPPVVIRKVPRATPAEPEVTTPATTAPVTEGSATAGPAPTAPSPRGGLRAAAVMALLAVVLGAFAVVAAFEPGVDRAADSSNTALVDTAATDAVAAAAVDAVQKTYSYSFSTIDSDLTAATDLMTPDMAAEHEKNIATIKDAVTQAQTTSKAQVTSDGVRTLEGDRAEVVAFVVVTSDNAGTALAPVPLRFTAQMQKIDGTWKLSGLVPS